MSFQYDQAKADRVTSFIETFCKHPKGSFAGKPFHLIDWQREFISELYGWQDGEVRQYRKALVTCGKGNGKTCFTSCLSLFHLLADGENSPYVVIAAASREQAGLCFDECLKMVQASKRLKDALHVVPSKKQIVYPKKQGVLKVISSDANSSHGLDCSLLVIDECAVVTDEEFWASLQWATSKDRRQPLTLYLTTAGYRKTGPYWNLYSYAKSLHEKKLEDPHFLAKIYETTPEDLKDIDNPEVWKKANPSLGVTIKEEVFRNDLEAAKASNASLGAFKRLRLNCFTSVETQFIELSHWDRCKGVFPALQGKPMICGVDLSSTSDLSCLVGVVPSDGKFYVHAWAWTTDAAVQKRARQSMQSWLTFIQAGELVQVDGNVIDYALIRQKVTEVNKVNPIKSIVFDKWNAAETSQILMQQGFEVFNLPQTPPYYNEPCRRLERLILDGKLVHDGNSLLRYNVACLQIKESNGLIAPSKEKSADKVDLCCALAMALSQCREGQLVPKRSVYEEPRLMVV